MAMYMRKATSQQQVLHLQAISSYVTLCQKKGGAITIFRKFSLPPFHSQTADENELDHLRGYLMVISDSRLSAWSTSFITHSM
jgi:hypothetical protein